MNIIVILQFYLLTKYRVKQTLKQQQKFFHLVRMDISWVYRKNHNFEQFTSLTYLWLESKFPTYLYISLEGMQRLSPPRRFRHRLNIEIGFAYRLHSAVALNNMILLNNHHLKKFIPHGWQCYELKSTRHSHFPPRPGSHQLMSQKRHKKVAPDQMFWLYCPFKVCHSSAFQTSSVRSVYFKIINYSGSILTNLKNTMQTKLRTMKRPHAYSNRKKIY